VDFIKIINTKISGIPLYCWILIVAILLIQATWLFVDARKRNANYWFWGIIGLLRFPEPLLFYLFLVRKIHKRKKKN
jgi:hypothetical protein